ncbi:MAG: hypothetical protein GY861_13930 [bacterium]|nr:hypothetical protein [bacterium]
MLDQDELTKKIAKLNKGLDGITDDLVKTTDQYQKEYERLLRNTNFALDGDNLKGTVANFNKAQSLKPLNKLGFNTLAVNHLKEYGDVAKGQLAFNKSIGIMADINFKDISIIKQLQTMDFSVFHAEASLLDERIKRELVNAIALEAPYQTTVNNLSRSLLGAGDKAGTLSGFANTYMRTALFSMARATDQAIYDKVGGAEPTALYIYAGPVDSKTRPFCMRHINKVYSRTKIMGFSSITKSPIDPFASPGGYNCRHYLVFITEEQAKEAGYTIIR